VNFRSYLGSMKEDRLVYLLESLLGKSKNARGGDEAVFSCPNCNHHKKKLTFNKYTQKFQCWVCGFKGARAIQLLKFIKAPYTAFQELKDIDTQYNFKTAHVEKPKDQLQLPEGFISLLKGKGLTRDKAWNYLKSRGVTAQDVVKYNIGYIEEGPLTNFIIIPSYDRHGILNYWVGRSFDPQAYHKELVRGRVKQIYLALDQDAINDSLKYAKELMSYGKEIFLLELGGKDPSEIGFGEMTRILQCAKPLTFQGLVEKKILYQ